MFKNTFLPVHKTLQSKGRLLDLSKPVVMGILNVTPDSFYNKGRGNSVSELLDTAGKMIQDGAVILDIGGASSRPGSAIIPQEEELRRILPLTEELRQHFPETWLSVDTYHSGTAREAVYSGAHIINDISSGSVDADMKRTVASLGVPYIPMHMQGLPENMQQNPQYDDVVYEVRDQLRQVCDECHTEGIKDIIIDPGFGFGKTVAHNFSLLSKLHTFRILGKPVLAGISRKSMICKTLDVSPEDALNGTTALHMIALQQGAGILRVHDVKEAIQAIKLFEAIRS